MFKFPRKNGSRLRLWIILIDAALIACAVCAYILISNQYKERYIPGTLINGTDVGGKYVSEVESSLSALFADYAIKIQFQGDDPVTLDGSDIFYRYVSDGTAAKTLAAQNRFLWLLGLLGRKTSVEVGTACVYDEPALRKFIDSLPQLKPENMEQPHDAYLTFDENSRLTLVPEVVGSTLDPALFETSLREALDNHQPLLDLASIDGMYELPEHCADDPHLVESMENVNDLLDITIAFTLSDGTQYIINEDRLMKLLRLRTDGTYQVMEDEIPDFARDCVAEMADYDDAYGKYHPFLTTLHGVIPLEADEMHGHLLDRTAMTAQLTEALEERRSAGYGPTYAAYIDHSDNRMGGTYIEIDIYKQHVYYYKDGVLDYDTPCVTGTEGLRETPSGIYKIFAKYRDTILEGPPLEDGTPSYSSHVDYFLAFKPGYGLHDAYWRSNAEFESGTTFYYDGSHGCVNLPHDAAEYLDANVELETPVIIFRRKEIEAADEM